MSAIVSSFGYPSVRLPYEENERVSVMRVESEKARTPHLRMTRRGRAVLLSLVTAPIVIAALALSLNAGGATATTSATPLKTVTVASGESLWQLAVKIAPDTDPREVIADIEQVNGLTSAALRPGQQLEIPAQYER